MKQPRFQTLLTSFLLIVFLADSTNALSLYTPHFVAFHEVGAHLETHGNSIHDECLKHPPLKHLIKFTDIDSPLFQVDCDSDTFSETLTYSVPNDCQTADAPPTLVSLHKLCLLLI